MGDWKSGPVRLSSNPQRRTAINVLGRVDRALNKLTDRTICSVDAAAGAESGPDPRSRFLMGLRCLGLGLAIVVMMMPGRMLAQTVDQCPTPLPTSGDKGGYCRLDAKNKIAIVFIHGVLGNYRSTWTSDVTKAYWPALMAKDKAFDGANIYVHGFVSPKLDTAQKVEELATRLGDALDVDKVVSMHSQLVFVTHSMGGLIVRAWLVQRGLPADRIPLIYFFGTPSGGANVAHIGTLLSHNPQFRDMLPFEPRGYVENLAFRWLATSQNAATRYPQLVWSFCAFEKRPMWGDVIVSEFSASFLCNTQPRAVVADHVGIVKPGSQTEDPYMFFAGAYAWVREQAVAKASSLLDLGSDKGTPIDIAGTGGQVLRLKRVTVNRSFEVGCGKEIRGRMEEVPVDLGGEEKLFVARAIVDSVRDLSRYSIEVVRLAERSVELAYYLKGREDVSSDCRAGNARVSVNYLVTAPRR
jgi:pimeloyl-ACP methyl ester carboxylesterase